MRVNPDMSGDLISEIWQTQSQQQTSLLELSTGKRVNTPSDDPLAAAQMVANSDHTARTDQYLHNLDTLTGQLQTADSAISSVVTALTRAITLGVQGSTGTVSDANRQQIAQDLIGIQAQVLQLANTEVNGTFLFGGTETSSPPFTLDPASATGVAYNGNDQTNNVQIADGLNVQTNKPGSQLFQGSTANVFGALQQLITALQAGSTSNAATATNQLRGAFDNLGSERIFFGNTVNQLNSTQTFLQQEKVSLSSQATSLIGADITKSASDLTRAQTAYSATLAAAAKILPTSLLDYLK
jgi:flagellar hook-associated protein 3 FlgL